MPPAGKKKSDNGALPIGTVDQILAVDDIDREGTVVPIEAWGVSVRVRGLTRQEALHIGKDEVSQDDAEVFILCRAVVEPKFSEEQARTVMTEKSIKGTEALLQAILEASGMTEGFREAKAS